MILWQVRESNRQYTSFVVQQSSTDYHWDVHNLFQWLTCTDEEPNILTGKETESIIRSFKSDQMLSNDCAQLLINFLYVKKWTLLNDCHHWTFYNEHIEFILHDDLSRLFMICKLFTPVFIQFNQNIGSKQNMSQKNVTFVNVQSWRTCLIILRGKCIRWTYPISSKPQIATRKQKRITSKCQRQKLHKEKWSRHAKSPKIPKGHTHKSEKNWLKT